MRFFADENFPPGAAAHLHLEASRKEHEVIHLLDQFPPGTPDTTWIRQVATWTPPPAILSGDGRILSNRAEVELLRHCNLSFFLFEKGWLRLPIHEWQWKALRIFPSILQTAASLREPTIFRVPVSSLRIQRVSKTAEFRG